MRFPPYLIDVLTALRGWHDDEVWFQVRQFGRHHYRVEAPDGWTIVVDVTRRLVDDSIEPMLPPEFPGRIEPEHIFRVEWLPLNGRPRSVEIEASSARIARIHLNAPSNAHVREVELGGFE